MKRRDMLALMAALAARPRAALAEEPGVQLGNSTPFSAGVVRMRAKQLAKKPYAPRRSIPESWRNLSYDQYRKIWFDGRNALWEGTEAPQRVDVFPPGLYFPHPVEIYAVDGAEARPLLFDMAVFDTTDQFPEVEVDDSLGYSGLRLRAELES
ncbi:MAG: glucan biosynthesis protein, partial [Pseudomonadota bacterium]